MPSEKAFVALRKESVDRNLETENCVAPATTSLSARRAWIEIGLPGRVAARPAVALRKESVDRNMPRENLVNGVGSLSARRAWIEIVISII